MRAPKPLAAGNWKMNGLKASEGQIADLAARLKAAPAGCDVLICPPFTLVASFADDAAGTGIAIGAQDCHAKVSGAHTGDISAAMLADAGAAFVIVGHSERRADHGEADETVAAKAAAALAAGLMAIVCVGETEAERVAGREVEVVSRQLAGSIPSDADAAHLVIAYEPVWAIGTGRTPSTADVEAIHAVVREKLVARFGAEKGAMIRILYGGSVKPENAKELMSVANVNGALVGGASLKAADFDAIIGAWR